MRVHNSLVSSLRKTFASHRVERAQRRELAALFSDPDLSPAAHQEIAAILTRHQGGLAVPISLPTQRRAAVGTPAGTRAAASR
jgi:hypothetical protein